MMGDFNLAEVEGHAGNPVRNAVWRGQAAQVRWFQCLSLDHRESRSSRFWGIVMAAGAIIIAKKARARKRSKTILGELLCGLFGRIQERFSAECNGG
jgi:hypothetical protein